MNEKNNKDDKRLNTLLNLVGIVNKADSTDKIYKTSEENYNRLSSLLDRANISEAEAREIKDKLDPKKGRANMVKDLSKKATNIKRAKEVMKPTIIEYEKRKKLEETIEDREL